MMVRYKFNPPPAWPPLPYPRWTPPPGWQAPKEWGPVPAGWQFWVPVRPNYTGIMIGITVSLLLIAAIIGVAVDHGGSLSSMDSYQLGNAMGAWLATWKGLIAAAAAGTPLAVYLLVRDHRLRAARERRNQLIWKAQH